ncbi:DEAD/DEAH box helicase [Limosilactobacillus mucosae]
MIEDYFGRRILVPIVDMPKTLPAKIKVLPTMKAAKSTIICQRCGARISLSAAALPNHEFYCPVCLNLGRVDTLSKFYHVAEPNQFCPPYPQLIWQGQLSLLQEQVAKEVQVSMCHHERRLIWAVTGAGKTEMMFKGLAERLRQGERIAWASPRVDVCLEIYPRLKKAFKNCEIALLYGKAQEPYHYRQLTVCTTHQLLRFYHAFDNLIIDEVDAFPFATNPQLYFAAQNAVKPDGGMTFLTATPGKALLQSVKRGQLQVSYLPLRYHGHLLPVPRVELTLNWRLQLQKGHLPPKVRQTLQHELATGQRFLLFVPHVKDLPAVKLALHNDLETMDFATVYASDPKRLEKVQAMRDQKYFFLVTTSILERGVTFPEIDVIILGADDEVFSASALVQMAGRAGRSQKRPTGSVWFYVGAMSRRVREALYQIAYMNQKGARLLAKMPALRRDD